MRSQSKELGWFITEITQTCVSALGSIRPGIYHMYNAFVWHVVHACPHMYVVYVSNIAMQYSFKVIVGRCTSRQVTDH